MLEKDVKQIKQRMTSIEDNTRQILEFLKSAIMPKTEQPKPIEHLNVSDLTKAVSILVKGDKKFIRVHAGKYDFGVALNDLNDGERLNWYDAMKMAEDDGLRLPNKEELMLMFVFKDEINALVRSDGSGYRYNLLGKGDTYKLGDSESARSGDGAGRFYAGVLGKAIPDEVCQSFLYICKMSSVV